MQLWVRAWTDVRILNREDDAGCKFPHRLIDSAGIVIIYADDEKHRKGRAMLSVACPGFNAPDVFYWSPRRIILVFRYL